MEFSSSLNWFCQVEVVGCRNSSASKDFITQIRLKKSFNLTSRQLLLISLK